MSACQFDYDERLIETLLATRWSAGVGAAPPRECQPDGDMPRGSSNLAETGSWMAFMADIGRAWQQAGTTSQEKRRLFLYFGANLTQREIAAVENVTQSAVWESIRAGVRKLAAHLNGRNHLEQD